MCIKIWAAIEDVLSGLLLLFWRLVGVEMRLLFHARKG